jgi:hypothetical protein
MIAPAITMIAPAIGRLKRLRAPTGVRCVGAP